MLAIRVWKERSIVMRPDSLRRGTFHRVFFGVRRLRVIKLKATIGGTTGGHLSSRDGYLTSQATPAATTTFTSKTSTWLDHGDTMLTASLSSGVVLSPTRESGIATRCRTTAR